LLFQVTLPDFILHFIFSKPGAILNFEAFIMNQEFYNKQRMLGLAYGLVAGLAFAILCWGIDAISLARANGSFPWIKILPGLVLSLSAGGLAGWITIRSESHWLALALWLGLAALFSWLTLWLQISSTPFLLKLFNPALQNYLEYPSINNQFQYWLVGFLILGLASMICGLLEINLIKGALLSSSGISSVAPIVLTLVVFGVAGSAMDYMLNTHFRTPVVVLNDLIDFAYDNKDVDVAPKIAREKRLSAVKDLTDLMDRKRDLTVIAYDRDLGQIDVLVNFNGLWVRCTVIYNQPVYCKRISTIPGIIDVNGASKPLRSLWVWDESKKMDFWDPAPFVILN